MKTILVVEDDEVLRSELLTILGFEGYEAIDAENGRVGIQLAQKHQPALIISDITMPVLDGIGMLQELRQIPQIAHIPIIFLSGETEPTRVQHSLQLGAAAFLSKPYTLVELLVTIKQHISS